MDFKANALEHLNGYITGGVSAFHVIAHTARLLREAGFIQLSMREPWRLEKGGRYFVSPFDTTLYAFTLGEDDPLGGRPLLAGAHVDFPALKLKPDPLLKRQGYLQLNTEVYGGPILNTWFDRPLGLAGKVAFRDGRGGVDTRYVNVTAPWLYLPNLAIHMNREINDNGKPIDQQTELLPLAGLVPEGDGENAFTSALEREAGLEKGSVLDWDLCLYEPQAPVRVGLEGEFLSSPRLDDLTSVSALIHGLIGAKRRPGGLSMVCLFDNEEIGSRTKQGADAQMPALILRKIWTAFGFTGEDAMSAMTGGTLLSVDVAHAYHPDYPQKQDITNFPVMGKGIVFKSAANQSYAWDCEAMAGALALCERAGIPCQRFVKRSGQKGGGTIGSMISSHLGIPVIDMGVGLLAMHSSCEMMGTADQAALEAFAEAYYSEM